MIRFVALDLDDTLLNDQLEIPDRCRAAVMAARQLVPITLATGRMFRSAVPYARALSLDADTPIIAYNGALVRTLAGDTLYHEPVPDAEGMELIALCAEQDLCLNIYVDEQLVVERPRIEVEWYEAIARVKATYVGDLAAFLRASGQGSTKMLVVAEPKRVQELLPKFKRHFGSRLMVAQSKPAFIEFCSPAVDKSRALAQVASQLGIQREHVLAIGDNFNDVGMIRWAGIGVAMGNAPKEVRAAADWVTATHNDSGVALALERYILKQTAVN